MINKGLSNSQLLTCLSRSGTSRWEKGAAGVGQVAHGPISGRGGGEGGGVTDIHVCGTLNFGNPLVHF